MSKMSIEDYEVKVRLYFEGLSAQLDSRAIYLETNDETGISFRLTPKTTGAISIEAHDISDDTVYLTLDDHWSLEFYMRRKYWDEDFQDVNRWINAAISGGITVFSDKRERTGAYIVTMRDEMGSQDYGVNTIFNKIFKKSKNTSVSSANAY